MANRSRRFTAAAASVLCLAAATACAREPFVDGRSTRSVATHAVRQDAGLFQGPASSWETPVRLPPVEPPVFQTEGTGRREPPAAQEADGTWHEDGRYIVINLDGRQFKLARSAPATDRQAMGDQPGPVGGTVYGRLLHRGRPLTNCRVMISPLSKGFTGYAPDRTRPPLHGASDERGMYHFEDVPPGAYKLSWLPPGQDRWIRRIANRPDVVVKANRPTRIKDIRSALATLN